MTDLDLIKPMLCKPVLAEDLSKFQGKYIPELKLDGMRAILYKQDGELRIFGRSGIEYTNHLSARTLAPLIKLIPDGTILDGELAHIAELKMLQGRVIPIVDFNKTMRVMGSGPSVARAKQTETKIDFIAFDVLRLENHDLMNSPYTIRSQALRDSFIDKLDIVPVWGYNSHLRLLFEGISKEGLEGLVLKSASGLYLPNKRNVSQLKVKSEKYFDVVVMGATAGKGKYEGMIGALRFGAWNGEALVEIGQCSGMTDAERFMWTKRLQTTQLSPDVIEIKCNDLLVTGTPRHPQYTRRRFDKHWRDCTIEQFNG